MVAYLPGQSTFEMQITSGKFEADLFVMTNSKEFIQNTSYKMPAHEVLTPATGTITLSHNNVDTSTISVYGGVDSTGASNGGIINGTQKFVQASTSSPGTGEFVFDNTGTKPTMTFNTADLTNVNEIAVDYYYTVTAQEANIDNRSSAIGEAILVYPVYGDAAECKTDSSIIGHVIMKVYKCRVTAQPGLDGSYKTASTYQFTLSAMDAKRADEATYSIAYIKA